MTIVAAQNGHHDQFMFKPFSSPRSAQCVANFPVVRLDKPEGLTGLAKFLFENVPATHRRRSVIVTCYAAEGSERELLRKKYANRPQYAENIIKVYGISEDARAVIQDWDFSLLRHAVSAEQYWEEQAGLMIAAGVKVVSVRASVGAAPVKFEI